MPRRAPFAVGAPGELRHSVGVYAPTLVVGAGVVGLAIARRLALDGHSVIVLEAADGIGQGISSRNSEVVHAGLYYPQDSLKARLCVAGREALYAYCADRGVVARRLGKLIVATDEAERAQIEAIHRQGIANGVVGLSLLDAREVAALEPELRTVGAILSTQTGIVDSHGLMVALQGEIEDHGGAIAFRCPFGRATRHGAGWLVECDDETGSRIEVARIVIAAGLASHRLAGRIEGMRAESIPPLRLAKGHYFGWRGRPVFSRLIYPAPVDGGLGVHATLDLAGRLRFGPDVEWIDEENYDVPADKAQVFAAAIRRYWPGVDADRLTPDYAGIRPKLAGPGATADFAIRGPESHGLDEVVTLFGIESPGLTAGLAIADHVAALLR
jgi:L-2-hydroxyglutarate oxidase LhgO